MKSPPNLPMKINVKTVTKCNCWWWYGRTFVPLLLGVIVFLVLALFNCGLDRPDPPLPQPVWSPTLLVYWVYKVDGKYLIGIMVLTFIQTYSHSHGEVKHLCEWPPSHILHSTTVGCFIVAILRAIGFLNLLLLLRTEEPEWLRKLFQNPIRKIKLGSQFPFLFRKSPIFFLWGKKRYWPAQWWRYRLPSIRGKFHAWTFPRMSC